MNEVARDLGIFPHNLGRWCTQYRKRGELEVIAAVVLGGASLAGGKGTVLGTVLGVTLIAIMWNSMVLIGISSYWHQVIIGLIILISIISSAHSSQKGILGGTKIDVE